MGQALSWPTPALGQGDRLDAVARLLARGILRVLGRGTLATSESGSSQEESAVPKPAGSVDSLSNQSVHVQGAESGIAPRRSG